MNPDNNFHLPFDQIAAAPEESRSKVLDGLARRLVLLSEQAYLEETAAILLKAISIHTDKTGLIPENTKASIPTPEQLELLFEKLKAIRQANEAAEQAASLTPIVPSVPVPVLPKAESKTLPGEVVDGLKLLAQEASQRSASRRGDEAKPINYEPRGKQLLIDVLAPEFRKKLPSIRFKPDLDEADPRAPIIVTSDELASLYSDIRINLLTDDNLDKLTSLDVLLVADLAMFVSDLDLAGYLLAEIKRRLTQLESEVDSTSPNPGSLYDKFNITLAGYGYINNVHLINIIDSLSKANNQSEVKRTLTEIIFLYADTFGDISNLQRNTPDLLLAIKRFFGTDTAKHFAEKLIESMNTAYADSRLIDLKRMVTTDALSKLIYPGEKPTEVVELFLNAMWQILTV